MDNLESFNSKVSKIEQSKEILEKKLNDLEDEIRLNLSEIVQLVDNLPDNHEDNLALETREGKRHIKVKVWENVVITTEDIANLEIVVILLTHLLYVTIS